MRVFEMAIIYDRLNPNVFFYVHQGYIVNFNHIWEVKEKVIVVTGALEVPVSRKYHNDMVTVQQAYAPEHLDGDITFQNVKFRYGTRKLVLDDVDLTIHKGEKVAFVGESGSGKTTLTKLLLHLYKPEEGNILINGNNIEDIQLETLRERIAYISQETFLFSGTIMENLMLGIDDASVDDVIEASKLAQAHEFINELPLRYETMLEENGANLSGGQRQRLTIACAMLKKPDLKLGMYCETKIVVEQKSVLRFLPDINDVL